MLHQRCYDRIGSRELETLLKSFCFCMGPVCFLSIVGARVLARYWCSKRWQQADGGDNTVFTVRYRPGRYIDIIGKTDKL